MTKLPLERQKKMSKTHLTPRKGQIHPRNIKNDKRTKSTSIRVAKKVLFYHLKSYFIYYTNLLYNTLNIQVSIFIYNPININVNWVNTHLTQLIIGWV